MRWYKLLLKMMKIPFVEKMGNSARLEHVSDKKNIQINLIFFFMQFRWTNIFLEFFTCVSMQRMLKKDSCIWKTNDEQYIFGTYTYCTLTVYTLYIQRADCSLLSFFKQLMAKYESSLSKFLRKSTTFPQNITLLSKTQLSSGLFHS